MWVEDRQGIRWMVKKSVWINSKPDDDIRVYNPQIGYYWRFKKGLIEVN